MRLVVVVVVGFLRVVVLVTTTRTNGVSYTCTNCVVGDGCGCVGAGVGVTGARLLLSDPAARCGRRENRC
jgi:hypothetical protein